MKSMTDTRLYSVSSLYYDSGKVVIVWLGNHN